MTGSFELSRALARGQIDAVESAADRAMLTYALDLTHDPGGMGPRHVETLREVGFDDTAILDICQVVSYYNYVNRLADGLGVEMEDFWESREWTMTREQFEAARAGDPG